MKLNASLLIRAALFGIASVVLFFTTFMIGEVHGKWTREVADLAGWKYPIIFVMTASVLTFLTVLAHIWKLLSLIDKDQAFSEGSVKIMRRVKYCGFIISGLFAT